MGDIAIQDELAEAFGKRLKRLRGELGWSSATDFSEIIGLEAQAYRKYERGESIPKLESLKRICECLSTTSDYLLFGTGEGRNACIRDAPDDIVDVKFGLGQLVVTLQDGRAIATPIIWYPRLREAAFAQLTNWKLSGGGSGIHWPELDEDLSIDGMLNGRAAVGWDR